MDYSKFLDDDFDAKEWINAAFRANRDSGTSNDQYATTLVMKLQMLIQEVNSVVETTSQEVVASLPRVLRDVEALRQDAVLLQEQMKLVKQDIHKVEKDTSQSMQVLLQLDMVKSRMEKASEALREADNWTVLSAEVESVIQSGDAEALASKIVAMQQSLTMLMTVPDYEDRCQHLDALKNRLETLVSPHVVSALASNSTDELKRYVNIFSSIHRLPHIYKYYEHFHKSQLTGAWTRLVDVDRSLPNTLSLYYDTVVSVLHTQVTWCAKVFDKPMEVVCSLITASLSALDPSIASCIALYLETQAEALEHICQLKLLTHRFAITLEKIIAEKSAVSLTENVVKDLVDVIFRPFKPYLEQHAKLEEHFMMAELERISLDHPDVDENILRLDQSISKVFQVCRTVNTRCMEFTSGYSYVKVTEVIRRFLSAYSAQFRRVIVNVGEKLKRQLDADVSECWAVFQLSLKLIQICGALILEAEEFDQLVVADIHTTQGHLESSYASPLTDLKRVSFLNSDDLAMLTVLVNNVTEKRVALGPSLRELRSLCEDAHKLAFSVVFSRVARHLDKLSEWKMWKSTSAGGALTSNLPTFSLSPQEYITQIGQYIMTVPQHLEPFTTGGSSAITVSTKYGKLPYITAADESATIDDVWLASISMATMHTYVEEILRIPEITDHATHQLTTDIDYFINVLDDLGLPPLDSLTVILSLLKASVSEFQQLRVSAPLRLVTAIELMRNLQ